METKLKLPWRRRRKRQTFEGNPFLSKKTLARFLGQLASSVFNGELTEREARACEKVIVDFFKLLSVKDFAFDVGDTIEPEPDRKLSYAA